MTVSELVNTAEYLLELHIEDYNIIVHNTDKDFPDDLLPAFGVMEINHSKKIVHLLCS